MATCSVDNRYRREVNARDFIVPGLGDAGDGTFGARLPADLQRVAAGSAIHRKRRDH
jgi:hypothetical protein